MGVKVGLHRWRQEPPVRERSRADHGARDRDLPPIHQLEACTEGRRQGRRVSIPGYHDPPVPSPGRRDAPLQAPRPARCILRSCRERSILQDPLHPRASPGGLLHPPPPYLASNHVVGCQTNCNKELVVALASGGEEKGVAQVQGEKAAHHEREGRRRRRGHHEAMGRVMTRGVASGERGEQAPGGW
ncbi:MAG: hypothetical protein MUF64_08410 [Polyangiaceae bacterium]|nr:hypothetical protein [Polyangiaceae bacterium]